MAQNFREPDILNIARTEGKVLVEDLARRFGVSVQTIRRDLSDLADAGKLERVHGGAVLPSAVSNIGYEDRRGLHDAAKADIARRCAEAIPDGASLFLNIGTSTEAVARALLHHTNLMVVTNNMNVANILVANTDCQIMVAGGMLRRSDGGLVGDMAARSIEQFKVDYAVIGCSALDADGDLLDFDVQEVGVSKAIIRQARRVFLVADHSKFQRSAPVRIASLRDMSTLFTDAPLSPPLTDLCARWDTTVSYG
ncbi:DeoR/GlpR family DNA-binding transcription regulator [Aliiroseovarius sp. YM-037]|uniref:DeoR/GlpR family DNA-binding transcription regulator n=1 Tax=Aliiroseovarius sp. YM-037 TaxID=3341728 RepID=UPI003A812BE1